MNIWEAVQRGEIEVVKDLIENGIDVNAGDHYHNTPLIWATGKENYKIIDYLLTKDADINETNDAGNTPLLIASARGNCDVTELLLENGAKIDLRNTQGSSPLSIAFMKGHFNVVKLLLRHGAEAKTLDKTIKKMMWESSKKQNYKFSLLYLRLGLPLCEHMKIKADFNKTLQ